MLPHIWRVAIKKLVVAEFGDECLQLLLLLLLLLHRAAEQENVMRHDCVRPVFITLIEILEIMTRQRPAEQ